MKHLLRLVLVGFGLILGLAACTANAPLPTSAPAATAIPTPTSGRATEPAAPAGAGLYDDIPQGVTSEGYQYLGDPAAPITMVMYSDFL